jgi:hypothetical protein
MTARAHSRGHDIEYLNGWVYSDTKEPIKKERPCNKCGQLPTNEGYDACLGYIKGIKSACCGHGIGKPIRIKDGN